MVAASNTFFFIFDFYQMKGAKDDYDVLPEAILYFYPEGTQMKKQVGFRFARPTRELSRVCP